MLITKNGSKPIRHSQPAESIASGSLTSYNPVADLAMSGQIRVESRKSIIFIKRFSYGARHPQAINIRDRG